mmetsp:Transcript_5412/g.12014  ORF Transcript_5412/g.12014 Transcript_5412/m.12014 type:complete len:80 (-) Transcript_5412:19-258(-)
MCWNCENVYHETKNRAGLGLRLAKQDHIPAPTTSGWQLRDKEGVDLLALAEWDFPRNLAVLIWESGVHNFELNLIFVDS